MTKRTNLNKSPSNKRKLESESAIIPPKKIIKANKKVIQTIQTNNIVETSLSNENVETLPNNDNVDNNTQTNNRINEVISPNNPVDNLLALKILL